MPVVYLMYRKLICSCSGCPTLYLQPPWSPHERHRQGQSRHAEVASQHLAARLLPFHSLPSKRDWHDHIPQLIYRTSNHLCRPSLLGRTMRFSSTLVLVHWQPMQISWWVPASSSRRAPSILLQSEPHHQKLCQDWSSRPSHKHRSAGCIYIAG